MTEKTEVNNMELIKIIALLALGGLIFGFMFTVGATWAHFIGKAYIPVNFCTPKMSVTHFYKTEDDSPRGEP